MSSFPWRWGPYRAAVKAFLGRVYSQLRCGDPRMMGRGRRCKPESRDPPPSQEGLHLELAFSPEIFPCKE